MKAHRQKTASRAAPEIRAMVDEALKIACAIVHDDEWYTRPDGPPSFSDIYVWVLQQAGEVAGGVELPADREPKESCVAVVARVLLVAERAQRHGAEEMADRLESAVVKSLKRYPGSRCMLLALGEEVGELGRAITGHVLRYPRGHKKHAGKREVLAECRDVAVVALRIALLGDDDFTPATTPPVAEQATS
jgi:NTP pyrophosphatase (non-canonical NTP hydrolase)